MALAALFETNGICLMQPTNLSLVLHWSRTAKLRVVGAGLSLFILTGRDLARRVSATQKRKRGKYAKAEFPIGLSLDCHMAEDEKSISGVAPDTPSKGIRPCQYFSPVVNRRRADSPLPFDFGDRSCLV